jgi:ATP-dependent protease HslVU (ClpYQ) peptidase subunit
VWAEGSGREIAIGAGHALTRLRPALPAAEVVRRAMDAAMAIDTTCGGRAWIAAITRDGARAARRATKG